TTLATPTESASGQKPPKRLYVVPGPEKGRPASPQPGLVAVVGCTAGCLQDLRRPGADSAGARETWGACPQSGFSVFSRTRYDAQPTMDVDRFRRNIEN